MCNTSSLLSSNECITSTVRLASQGVVFDKYPIVCSVYSPPLIYTLIYLLSSDHPDIPLLRWYWWTHFCICTYCGLVGLGGNPWLRVNPRFHHVLHHVLHLLRCGIQFHFPDRFHCTRHCRNWCHILTGWPVPGNLPVRLFSLTTNYSVPDLSSISFHHCLFSSPSKCEQPYSILRISDSWSRCSPPWYAPWWVCGTLYISDRIIPLS